MNLIINADDFGLSKALNYGIIEAHKNGVVTSTTALVNGYAFEDCLLLSKQSPLLSIGIHLNITMFKALSGVSTLTDENGNFKNKQEYTKDFTGSLIDLEKEYRAQIEYFIKIMKKLPSHIDSHHHTHLLPRIRPLLQKIALEYGLMVRGYNQIILDDTFYGDNLTIDFFKDYSSNNTIELMVHPAYIDHDLMQATSYNLARLNEYEILCSDKVKEYLALNNVKLISYLDKEAKSCY